MNYEKKIKIDINKGYFIDLFEVNLVKKYCEMGLSCQQIAWKIGRGKNSISRIIKKHNLNYVYLSKKISKKLSEEKIKNIDLILQTKIENLEKRIENDLSNMQIKIENFEMQIEILVDQIKKH